MKVVCIIVILSLFVCCRNHSEHIRTHLLSEAPALTIKERSRPPYQIENCGNKIQPCLIQPADVSSDFFIHLHKNPVLQLRVLRTKSIEPRILVESDLPDFKRQEYAIHGSSQNIPLKEFEGRVVRIRLFSKRRENDDQNVQWVDPIILQERTVNSPRASNDLQALRKRHRGDNVFLIILDAAGASHFGYSGSAGNPTPVIDALAADGILWDHAVSPAASTVASTGSLLTGLYPLQHKTLLSNNFLQQNFYTLPEIFRANGYRTALFSGNPNASSMTGYDQGFEYLWQPHTGRIVNAADFVQPFQDWIASHKEEKLFAYLHFREPHSPYTPPAQIWKKIDSQTDYKLPDFSMFEMPERQRLQKVMKAYVANLASADLELGRMFTYLKDAGLWDHSVIIVMADHGEAFWEHGKQGHNYPLYEENVRIPFVMRIPGEKKIAGKRISVPAGTIDLYPTLADLFLFSERGTRWSGMSLLPSIYGISTSDRLLISQTVRKRIYSSRWQNMKYIWHKEDGIDQDELYSLEKDPLEKNNLIQQLPVIGAYLHLQLAKYLRESLLDRAPATKTEKPPKMDQEIQEELKALGYVN